MAGLLGLVAEFAPQASQFLPFVVFSKTLPDMAVPRTPPLHSSDTYLPDGKACLKTAVQTHDMGWT